jgi:hypothetical protein
MYRLSVLHSVAALPQAKGGASIPPIAALYVRCGTSLEVVNV